MWITVGVFVFNFMLVLFIGEGWFVVLRLVRFCCLTCFGLLSLLTGCVVLVCLLDCWFMVN